MTTKSRGHGASLLVLAWSLCVALFSGGCARGDSTSQESTARGSAPFAAEAVLEVTPARASIPATVQRQFQATLVRRHERPRTLSDDVAWTVSDGTVATIDAAGLLTARAPGCATVTATYEGLTATATVTVTTATLVSLAVTPPERRIHVGSHAHFRATGTFSDGRTFPLGGGVAWTSSDTAVATVGSRGRAEGVAPGIAAITATDTATGLTGKAFLTVGSASLASLTVTPAAPSVPTGLAQSFTATGTFTDKSTEDLTDAATWSSASPGVATISNASGSEGVATAAGAGTTTITARVGHATATATLTVTAASAPVLTAIAVTPGTASIPNGTTRAFVATGTYSDHTTHDVTGAVTWTSSSPAASRSRRCPGMCGRGRHRMSRWPAGRRARSAHRAD